jgi:hypothetical protein
LSEKDAKLVLELHRALENPSLGMRSAGIQRIARACIAQSPEFAQRMAERFGGQTELGRLFGQWLREEKGRPIKADGGRIDIVEQLERLAQKNIVDRPMRLPPPMMRPPPPPPQAIQAEPPRSSTGQSRVLVPPPQPRKPTTSIPQVPRHDPSLDSPRREGGERSRAKAVPSGLTDSQSRAQVLRDGKPLERAKDPPRRQTSPVQEVPRRRDPGAARSPVVKGGPGRGPKDGSR